MYDITKLMFQSSIWLLIALLLYYLLSVGKVFLLVRVQPALFQFPDMNLSVGQVSQKFFKRLTTDGMLHRQTFNYLRNKGGKNTWILTGNKKINLYFQLLDWAFRQKWPAVPHLNCHPISL